MKKRILFTAKIIFGVLFVFSILAVILQLWGNSNPLSRFDPGKASYNHIEAYNPALSRLNSIKKLEQYCDSMYAERVFADKSTNFERTYTDVVSNAVRDRFYHGYSYYGFSNNYLGALASRVTIPGLSALVIPDEILKHPYAACSQQSIVMMDVLQDKGFKTRKIVFQGKEYGGHFAFEVFYEGSWHFSDPNMEPDKAVLNSYGRPGIDFLAHNPEVLLKAYRRDPTAKILDIFSHYSYGPVNTFPAPKAIIFQRVTRFLSYTIWVFFLIGFIITRRAYLRVKSKTPVYTMAPIRQITPIPSSSYYPEFKVQGK